MRSTLGPSICLVFLLSSTAACSAISKQALSQPAPSSSVGSIVFPTSGTPEAQAHFLRGVAILHSFGYDEARQEFRKAQELDPDFALAYWGESFCFNHLLQPERDLDSPRAVLQRLGATLAERLAKAPTEREKGFLLAAHALWMIPEDEGTRRIRHLEAMEELHRAYPNDPEVTTFYALALLTAIGPLGEDTYRLSMQAGALALNVLAANPEHPGAAHYAIHAFDDPVHAALGLPAARRFARIAPAVSHALHMPSHIFIQLGMWAEALQSNKAAYEAAARVWKPGGRVLDMLHAVDWGHYASLQVGDDAAARSWREIAERLVTDSGDSAPAESTLALIRARDVVELGISEVPTVADSDTSEPQLLATGLAALAAGRINVAEAARARLADIARRPAQVSSATFSRGTRPLEIAQLELSAGIQLARGESAAALGELEKAVRLAEAMGAPRGPALPVKPAHELQAETLLAMGRTQEAIAGFRASLLRTPNRPLSLLGLARAFAAQGDRRAASATYASLIAVRSARPDGADVREAREYLAEAGMSDSALRSAPRVEPVPPASK